MSSSDLENSNWSPRNPAERILMQLKMHGGLTAAALGKMLGTTGEAARQQLAKLAEEGLVAARNISAGVGRPTQMWELTPAAQARFPDTHAALTVQLLDILRSSLGEDALDSIILKREEETRKAYEQAMSGLDDLKERVVALAALRSSEGYMAQVEETPDGFLALIENHCPICAAAASCQGFCRAELQVFRSVLGENTVVDRVEHIVQGGRRCTYLIKDMSA